MYIRSYIVTIRPPVGRCDAATEDGVHAGSEERRHGHAELLQATVTCTPPQRLGSGGSYPLRGQYPRPSLGLQGTRTQGSKVQCLVSTVTGTVRAGRQAASVPAPWMRPTPSSPLRVLSTRWPAQRPAQSQPHPEAARLLGSAQRRLDVSRPLWLVTHRGSPPPPEHWHKNKRMKRLFGGTLSRSLPLYQAGCGLWSTMKSEPRRRPDAMRLSDTRLDSTSDSVK